MMPLLIPASSLTVKSMAISHIAYIKTLMTPILKLFINCLGENIEDRYNHFVDSSYTSESYRSRYSSQSYEDNPNQYNSNSNNSRFEIQRDETYTPPQLPQENLYAQSSENLYAQRSGSENLYPYYQEAMNYSKHLQPYMTNALGSSSNLNDMNESMPKSYYDSNKSYRQDLSEFYTPAQSAYIETPQKQSLFYTMDSQINSNLYL